jgi:large subunit ribosomal protein L17
MRHRKAGVKLNMSSSHRQAMFRNMVTSLFKHDRIRTTNVRAKELRRWADHIITLAKRGDLHARRQALAIVREKDVVHKLFEEAQKRFGKTNGGYTRITKLGRRPGDAAPISIIELISAEEKPKKKKKKAKAPKKAAAPTQAATDKPDTKETPEAVDAAESGQAEAETEKEEKEASADESQAADAEAPEGAQAEAAEAPAEADTTAESEDDSEQPSEKKED